MVSESVLCRKDLSALLDVIYSKVEVVDLIFVDMIEGIEGEWWYKVAPSGILLLCGSYFKLRLQLSSRIQFH